MNHISETSDDSSSLSSQTSSSSSSRSHRMVTLGGSARKRTSTFVRKERRLRKAAVGINLAKKKSSADDNALTESPTTRKSSHSTSLDQLCASSTSPTDSSSSGDLSDRISNNSKESNAEQKLDRGYKQRRANNNNSRAKSASEGLNGESALVLVPDLSRELVQTPENETQQSPLSPTPYLQLPALTGTWPKSSQKSHRTLASKRNEVHNPLKETAPSQQAPPLQTEKAQVDTTNVPTNLSLTNSNVQGSSSVLEPESDSMPFSSLIRNKNTKPFGSKLEKQPYQYPGDTTVSSSSSSTESQSSSPVVVETPPMKCLPPRTPNLFDGKLYRDRAQAVAVLSVAESKRQCCLQNELSAGEREWEYYLSRLDTATQETQQIETFLANSNVALVQYSQAIDEMCAGVFATNTVVDVEEHIDQKSSNPMFSTLASCYGALKESLESQLPEMTDSLRQATLLKAEVGTKAAELEKRGKAIGWHDAKRIEETIRDSFEALMTILTEQVDPSAVEPRDRWLAEARYRNSARLGMDTWRATRNAYQAVYGDFWKMEDARKEKQKKILEGFMPLRQSLMETTSFAFDAGADVVGGEAKLPNLLKDFEPSKGITGTKRSIWDSPYVEDCRVVQVKVGREWKTAVAVKSLERELHLYVSTETQWLPLDNMKTKVEGLDSCMSANLPDYKIVVLDGGNVELEKTGRSKIFRKRNDHITVQLKGTDEASRWCNLLLEMTDNGENHC